MNQEPFYTNSEKDRPGLLVFLKNVPLDKPLVWEVRDKPTARSIQQNNLYWKWVGIIARDTGNDTYGLHEVFKQKFLVPTVVDLKGEITKVYTTKKLKVREMSEYMERVSALAGEYGIYLPIPEELHMRDVG